LSEAQSLYRKGDFDSALRNYQRVLQDQPKSGEAYAGLVRVCLKKKDVQKAFELAERGRVVADSAAVRVALGEVYFRQGKIHEAENEWVDLINSGHREARAYLGLAHVRFALSMYKTGRKMIDTAYELDPTDPEIRKVWAGTQNRAERIKFLDQYLAGENNEDAETRAALQHELEFLKARAQDSRGACHLVNKITTTDTELVYLPTDRSRLRGFGLVVTVNGEKSRLLLDTGAGGIIINRNLAEKAGVTRISELEVAGIGDQGNMSGYRGLAKSLGIGELEFQDCTVQVLDQRSVTGEDGLIGADVFSAFLVDLDFPKETLRLRELPKRPEEITSSIALHTGNETATKTEEPADKTAATNPAPSAASHPGHQDRYIAPEMKSFTKIYRFGHSLLVPTFVGDNDMPARLFMLDTGAFDNLITPDAASEVTKVRGDYGTRIKGLGGSVRKVYRADKAVLKFGRLQQHNQVLVAVNLTHVSDRLGTEVSGMLGFTMLRLLDIKIDYRDGLVDFSYDPKRFGR